MASRPTPVLLLLGLLFPACSGEQEPPDAVPPERVDAILEAFNRGVGLMDRFQPVEATKAFEEVVALAPGWTTGRLNLGIALMNSQTEATDARAEQELRRVAEAAPDNCHAHYALGVLLRHLGRTDEAREQFERVLQIDPDDPDAHYQLGILLVDSDPAAARAHFERTLAEIPHHESATYRLFTLMQQAGEKDRAAELLARFGALKSSGSGVFSGMRYGEMGRYAEVIRTFDLPGEPVGSGSVAPELTDAASAAGLDRAAGGVPGWPGDDLDAIRLHGAAVFGPGVAVADVDGDGSLDVYTTGTAGGGTLYAGDTGRFAPVADSGIDGTDAAGAFFGDYDGDGDPDLFLTCAGPDRLYRNDGSGRFADVTAASGLAAGGDAALGVGALWLDADHDGDLDLYVANFCAWPLPAEAGPGAPNALWRNNGDGTFTDVAAEAGIDGGDAATVAVLAFDADDDRDLDLYLIQHRAPNRLFLNDRVGRYRLAPDRFAPLADDGPGYGALCGDLGNDGHEDLLLLKGPEPPRLFRQIGRGTFVEEAGFESTGAIGGLFVDLDLDGDLDLVLLGSRDAGHRVRMNDGAGRFAPPVALGTGDARGAVAADFDADGALDLLVTLAGEAPRLWRSSPPPGAHWLEVVPAADPASGSRWIHEDAVGLTVEVKSGPLVQLASLTSSSGYLSSPPPRAHFGLGTFAKADYVRLMWPDAVLQSELEIAADQVWRVGKIVRKPSSCPVLFSWDGERFRFVTDFNGVGGVGFFVAPGEYAPPDPTEDVRISPELSAPRDGRYLLRVAEPLEEVCYLDRLELRVYDHPAAIEVHPDERFTGSPPWPTGRPVAIREKVFPRAARDHRGGSVLDAVLEIDRDYVEPPKDPRFVGYADDHWLELDFGDRLRALPADGRLVLCLHGWVEYTYSHVNYAAYQAGLSMRPPSIEVPDGEGGWKVAVPEMGFPAGLPRTMTFDVTDLGLRETGRLRIRTNMEVFWDQAFVGADAGPDAVTSHVLQPAVAELRVLGYPREFSPDGRDPTIYDYHRVDRGVAFKNMSGDYTRFGDVRPLLGAADDRFVIFGKGEEIALEFDADALPPLPAGFTRTLVLHTDGYCKDMDLYTAFPDTVEPLPHHGMANYPPESPPADEDALREYRETWNTRRIESFRDGSAR